MMKLAVALVLVSCLSMGVLEAFSPPSRSSIRRVTPFLFSSTEEQERDRAVADYLGSANEETMEALLQLEQEKQKQIQAMKMQLYQDMNSALREKELQAMRLKLESLRQKMEDRLELQASIEALRAETKASELQDLRIRLQELVDQRNRIVQNEGKQNWLQNILWKTGSAEKKLSTSKANSVKPNPTMSQGLVRKEPEKRNGVEAKSTVKLGPFTKRA